MITTKLIKLVYTIGRSHGTVVNSYDMPVIGSSPELSMLLYVGLTILLWGKINKSLKAKSTSGRHALTENGCLAK